MFKVTARTILELGSELISSDAIAFYELIKNGIDAGSKNGVEINFDIVLGRRDYQESKTRIQLALKESGNQPSLADLKSEIADKLNTEADLLWDKASAILADAASIEQLSQAIDQIYDLNSITISDTGSGMSLEELNTVFLVIGTSSRKNEIDAALASGKSHAPFLGEKGIGRLSAMRLGDYLSVRTSRSNDECDNCIDIDWSAFDDSSKMIEEIKIEPRTEQKQDDSVTSGTKIRISKLNADWGEKRVERLAIDDFSLLANPLGEAAGQRIAVFWNAKRVDISRLDNDFLSHANAQVRGKYRMGSDGPELELRIDLLNLGFEHAPEVSIEIATPADLAAALVGPIVNRKRMHKRDVDYAALNSVGPFEFKLYWFNRALLRKVETTGEDQRLINALNQWMGVRLYRDGFRVYPYGSEDDDWLELDKKALASQGYTLNRIQFVGEVEISRLENPQLVDQTNREGLRQTPEEAILKETIQYAVGRLRYKMQRIAREHKASKEPFVPDAGKTADLEARMKTAIQKIQKIVPAQHQKTVKELELLREEFSSYASQARERIADMGKDADQMLVMAGIGLMVEVVAHELTRSAEDALDVLNSLKRKTVPDDIQRRLESLRASMTSISKRLRILDPLSVTGRQRKERFDLGELLSEILEAHEVQFARHHIQLNVALVNRSVNVSAVKGMVVQVLENLFSNSIYWLDIEKQRKISFQPKINIVLENHPPRIRFSDNGPGVSEQYQDRIFDLFFSLKDKSRRRGLGLYIAREAAEHNGGCLTLDTETTNDEGRCSTFDYLVVEDKNE